MSRWPREQEGQNSASIVSKSLSWRSAESWKNRLYRKTEQQPDEFYVKTSAMSLTVLLYSIYSENSRRFANSSKALENKRKYMRNYETRAFETDDFHVKIYINQNIQRAAVFGLIFALLPRPVVLFAMTRKAARLSDPVRLQSSRGQTILVISETRPEIERLAHARFSFQVE